jgi:FPC/CPF motif-containing protein YcgG
MDATTAEHVRQGTAGATGIPADFAAFIKSDAFPCVGAKSVLALDRLVAFEAGSIVSNASDEDLYEALCRFGAADDGSPALRSFVCLFFDREPMAEADFEMAMWARMQALHERDAARNVAWADGVSNRPDSPHFSMSVAGHAYFLVGLHPGASRGARRFARPAIVFNPHEQFQRLRTDGRYTQIQSINRERELASHGSLNPMLADFGVGREAAQYSGRQVGADWTCPFKART